MATLKPRLILKCSDATDDILNLNVSDQLSVTDPFISPSKVACTVTGNETIILPDLDTTRYVYIKNTGLDASDAPTAATVKVEIANSTRIIDLASEEFCFFPHKAENSGLLQLEASAGTVIAEYAYWTKV